jgi:hypothetical protein
VFEGGCYAIEKIKRFVFIYFLKFFIIILESM